MTFWQILRSITWLEWLLIVGSVLLSVLFGLLLPDGWRLTLGMAPTVVVVNVVIAIAAGRGER